MNGRESALQTLRELSGTTVATSVATATRSLGIDSTVNRFYRGILSRVAPSEQLITVRGITQRFRVSSLNEYEMFQWYPEQSCTFPVLPDIVDRLDSNDVFWDVGANIGIYTCFGATQIDSGHVISIEPNPNNVSRIKENLVLNNSSAQIHPCALMRLPGELKINAAESDLVGSYDSTTPPEDSEHTIEVTTGDRLVGQGIPAPTVLKVDVEGAELDVFHGMERTISRPECRLIYCNVTGTGDDSRSVAVDERKWLEENAFDVEVLWEWVLGGQCGQYIRAVQI